MQYLQFIIDLLNTEAGAALVMAFVAWLSVYLPTKNREALDRAASLGMHFAEQMKRQGKITTSEDAKAAAISAAKASLPMAVRLVTRNVTLANAVEAMVGMSNAGKGDQIVTVTADK